MRPASSQPPAPASSGSPISKPEPLKYGFQGYWSRRITDEHRFIYEVIDDEIRVAQCRYHYEV